MKTMKWKFYSLAFDSRNVYPHRLQQRRQQRQ